MGHLKNRLCWDKLLSPCRPTIVIKDGKESVSIRNRLDKGDSRSPFEKDYCHLIYSGSFRRLGRKTQVYPFASVDYVRCRLTHSLEVSTIAVSLLREAVILFEAEGRHPFHYQDAEWVLRTAGLAHDIGNPPYGHAGEAAIREWAKENLDQKESYYRDFRYYDGNGQSFRLLARNDIRKTLYHNLTVASLGAIVKYPYDVNKATDSHPKFGAFLSENHVFDVVMDTMGLKTEDGSYVRHPLSFLLEAADDISYCLSDLEDGVKMGVLKEAAVRRLFYQILPDKAIMKAKRQTDVQHKSPKQIWASLGLDMLRSKVAEVLIKGYSKCFYENYEDIMNGSLGSGKDFVDRLPNEVIRWHDAVQKTCQTVYASVIKQEKRGRNAIHCKLDEYMELLKYINCRETRLTDDEKSKVLQVLGDDFFEQRKLHPKAWWAHVVLDYVVGMTDDFVIKNAV